MKREDAITKLLNAVSKDNLQQVALEIDYEHPNNFLLKLFCGSFSPASDTGNKWFTAFGVLCLFQRQLCSRIIQGANVRAGNPPLKVAAKRALIDAVTAGCKLTRADAG